MSVKKVLLAVSASLAGLLILAGSWSPAFAVQSVLTCNNDSGFVAAGATTVVTCTTTDIKLITFDNLTVDYVAVDAQAGSPKVIINSIEATMNVNNNSGPQDFMDVGFSPYINMTGGGGITSPSVNFSTYGGTQSPNISLDKTTIQKWTVLQGLGLPTNITFEAQVFVTNTDTSASHGVFNTLRVIVDTYTTAS